ncbi:MAG: zinc-dependent metalloprotease [Bacteroidota bacterium]|nr:zinc-dependent metalloprotease [Bacteroidota bacterium]
MRTFTQLSITLLLFLAMSITAMDASAQQKRSGNPSPQAQATGTPASPQSQTAAAQKGPKPYKEVITDKAKTTKGLFTVHKVEDKFYFELADSIMKREFIAITRYAKTSTGAGFGGEIVNQAVLYFEKGPENKILLRTSLVVNMAADPTQPLAQAVENSNLDPIVAAFDIKALGKDSTSVVIDVTDFFKSENAVITMSNDAKTQYKLGSPQSDRVFIESIRSYPINTEVKVSKTFSINTAPSGSSTTRVGAERPLPATEAGVATFEFNISMLLLPKTPMHRRAFDARVGYFADSYTSFDENKQGSKKETFAVRWRLEPKPQDVEKMKRGELVEPKKPIVYYIDPATPKKWRKYLIQGIEDWNVAFEQAGFKNAVRAYEWPEKDSTMSLEDARYSVVRYFAADIENAYGPNVHDPRSGEIIESHIGWYNDVIKRLYKWYLIQTATIDPRAHNKEYDDELMGQLMRYVVCHEVGHTLGLRHNFAASAAMPVEKLRDKEFISKYGQSASIMDYSRFNYVAQPGDGITQLIPRISVYDKWAIEWGYKPILDAKDDKAEKLELNKWVRSHESDKMYLFGTESSPYDPRFQSEDLGDNAMKAGEYGIKNLKLILPHLIEWTKEDGEDYTDLATMYGELTAQFSRYMGHAAKNVGGVYETSKTYDMPGGQFEVVPRATQKEAVTFLTKNVFTTPAWLLDKDIMSRISHTGGLEVITPIQ